MDKYVPTREVICPKCKYEFRVNANDRDDPAECYYCKCFEAGEDTPVYWKRDYYNNRRVRMKKQMVSTKGEISVLGNTLASMPKIGGIDFQFNIKRTVKGLVKIQEESNKIFVPIPKFIEYEKAVRKMYEDSCIRDEDGKPVLGEKDGQQVYTFEDEGVVSASLELLEEKYSDGLKTRREQITAYNKLMGEEVTVDIYTIKDEQFPDPMPEGLTEEQMNALVILAEV